MEGSPWPRPKSRAGGNATQSLATESRTQYARDVGSLEDEIAAQDAVKSADDARRAAEAQVQLDAITVCAREFATAAEGLGIAVRKFEGTKVSGWRVDLTRGLEYYPVSIAVFPDGGWTLTKGVMKSRFFGRESHEQAVVAGFPAESFHDGPDAIRSTFASRLREYRDAI